MHRTKFLAAVVVVLGVVGALVATRLGSDDPPDAASDTAEMAQTAETATGPATTGGAAARPADDDEADDVETADPPPVLEPKPDLTDIDGWLQTEATSLDDFAGQVRIVEFWTFGCFNCKNRLPHTKALYEEYHPRGLEIIGVHAPEFDHERDPERIAQAAIDLGVVWPVALDTNKTNFRAWQGGRRFWPRVYVLDQDGQVRYDHIGEGDYDGLEQTVAHLIEHGP